MGIFHHMTGSELFTLKVKSMTVRTDNSQHAQVQIVNIVL